MSACRRARVADATIGGIAGDLGGRGALEALWGELACMFATEAEIDEIADLNAAMIAHDETDDPVTAFERDMAFHRAIVEAGRNAPLAETHATYNARLWRARFMSSQRRAGRAERNAEHAAIVEALRRRDEEAAAAALSTHLDTAVKNIKHALRDRDRRGAR